MIAYLVLHRRHEIGVRAALGADRRDDVGMVIRQVLGLAGAGTVIGLAVALAAGALPAWRASRVSPTEALRD